MITDDAPHPHAPRVHAPCKWGGSPHRFSPWQTIRTPQGVKETHTCQGCGHEERRDVED